jgi:hypothetical protein
MRPSKRQSFEERMLPWTRWSAPNQMSHWKCTQSHWTIQSCYRIFGTLHPSRCPSQTLQVIQWPTRPISNQRRCRYIRYRTQCTRATWERLSWRRGKKMIKIGSGSAESIYMNMYLHFFGVIGHFGDWWLRRLGFNLGCGRRSKAMKWLVHGTDIGDRINRTIWKV